MSDFLPVNFAVVSPSVSNAVANFFLLQNLTNWINWKVYAAKITNIKETKLNSWMEIFSNIEQASCLYQKPKQ